MSFAGRRRLQLPHRGGGQFAAFGLLPQVNGVADGVQVLPGNDLANVSAVPEPSSLLPGLAAFGMLGLVRRKRASSRREPV
jgi:hypothetical protein